MSSVMKRIQDKEVECFEVGNTGKMLLQLTGAFGGDTVRNSFMLVPMTMEEAQLEHLADLWLSEQEMELGLPVGASCSSSGWWVGSNEKVWLEEITDKYNHLIPIAEEGFCPANGYETDVLLNNQRTIIADNDKLLSYGACGNSFYAIQHHEHKGSAPYFSLYVVDRQPTSMAPASVEQFMLANQDRGWSSAGSWDQVMSELQDFIMDMNSLRHVVEQERCEDEAKLPVHRVTFIRERYSENETWIDDFWVDAQQTPSKELFQAAVTEFLNTPEGQRAIQDSCEDFNWGDAIMYVPNAIWNKHGIYPDHRYLTPAQMDLAPTSSESQFSIKVDQDELLIPDSCFEKASSCQPLENIIQSASKRTSVPSSENKSTSERDH